MYIVYNDWISVWYIEGIDKILLRTIYNIGSFLIMFQTHQTH